MADPVLLLGDERLREVCAPVEDFSSAALLAEAQRLHAVLETFRARHGFGRGIAAPQIGIARRFIALNYGGPPVTLVNPEIIWASPETFTMWDDCMSFPPLLVRVRRHCAISVRFCDLDGQPRLWERLDASVSELLQHEMDHLDGVLAVDRALDREAVILREVFLARREHFEAHVDPLPKPGALPVG